MRIQHFSAGLLCVLSLLGVGCSSSKSETALTPKMLTDEVKTISSQPCGDGVCDAAELADATLCPADCTDGTTILEADADMGDDTTTTSGDEFSFIPDEDIRIEDASNSGVKYNTDGTISLLFQTRSNQARGRNDIATASVASDWLDFTVSKTGVNPAEFRALRLADGTCRAYGLDATKSGVLPGSTGLKSMSSKDCVTFTEDTGVRYELTEKDNESMGVYDLFIDSKGGVVLLYLGDLKGTNNLRRAYSTDGGWTFTFQDDNLLGDIAAGGGGQSYVDNKIIELIDGRVLMVAMKAGKIYTFVSADEGVTWTKQPDVLAPEDFTGQSVTGLYDPQIIQLSDGRFRIYVTGGVGTPSASEQNSTQNLYSATTAE